MKSNRFLDRFNLGFMGMLLFLNCQVVKAQDNGSVAAGLRVYQADVSLYSIEPNKGLGTYRAGNGTGNFSDRGTCGLGISRGEQQLEMQITGEKKAERFLAKLTIKSKNRNDSAKKEILNQELDLTDLKAQTIEIARDDDGRAYYVNVVPSVKETVPPKTFSVTSLGLDQWSFADSPVIVNDQDYVGTLNMSGGRFATIDIAGLALVEFSLVPFKDAQPEGVLNHGTLTISHGETNIQIKGARNGVNAEELKGGPYRVFARWKQPSQTAQQARDLIAQQIQSAKTRIDPKDPQMAAALARMEKMAKSDRVMLMSMSISDIKKADSIERQP